MKAPPWSSFDPNRWPAGVRRLLLFLGWAALTVAFFQPATRVLDGDLDSSIFSSYAYFVARGFQFGPEVVAMAGPYGFIMYGHYYGGDLFWTRLAGELALEGSLAVLVLWFFLRQRCHPWLRWIWFPTHLLFTTYISDLAVAWGMVLAGLMLLDPPASGGRRLPLVFASSVLGWLGLFKGTHLMLSFAAIAVVVATWLVLRQWRRALLIAGCYAGALLGFWVLVRQNPLNLPAYVAGTWHLAQSYGGTMSVEEPPEIFARGAAAAGGLLLALGVTAWVRRREPLALGGLGLLAGFTLMMWKHGFVRADGHIGIFFCFTGVAVVAWCLHFVFNQAGLTIRPKLAAAATTVALLLILFQGPYHPIRPPLAYMLRQVWPSFVQHGMHLANPAASRREIERRLAGQRKSNRLPETLDTVGHAAIDYFGVQQGILPLIGLNYRPRPMGGGAFNVYDSYLMGLNRDFLRDPARRPDFYLVRPASIDNRLVAQDDGLALLELLRGYRPVLLEQNRLLLRAEPVPPPAVPRPVSRRTFTFGESVPVPAVGNDELLLARFVIPDNWAGRIRNQLYKTPPLSITLRDRDGGELGERRLVPLMAVSPFLFSPLIEDNHDLLGVYGRESGRQPGTFVVTSPGRRFFSEAMTVEFSAIPRPVPVDSYQLKGLFARLRFPYANAVPESITPPFQTDPVVRYVHAPSEIVWTLTGEERELAFHYGLDARTYEEGTTNGVEFIVEIRGPSGSVTRVFSRLLRPRTQTGDRGGQVALVRLPVYAPGSRLVLRTDPGEYGDNAWDWAYATRIELRQGRFAAEQFPGFNRPPDLAEGEYTGVVELDGQRVSLLHVPARVGFTLTGQERSLAFDFGFLPGAYSDGGQTAGADYVVEWVRGGRIEQVFRRTLRPLATPGDRGRQSALVTLPAVQAGDVLQLRTTPAPGASNSWGWTYVSRLSVE